MLFVCPLRLADDAVEVGGIAADAPAPHRREHAGRAAKGQRAFVLHGGYARTQYPLQVRADAVAGIKQAVELKELCRKQGAGMAERQLPPAPSAGCLWGNGPHQFPAVRNHRAVDNIWRRGCNQGERLAQALRLQSVADTEKAEIVCSWVCCNGMIPSLVDAASRQDGGIWAAEALAQKRNGFVCGAAINDRHAHPGSAAALPQNFDVAADLSRFIEACCD